MASLPPVARNVYVFCKKCDTDRYFKVLTHTSLTTAKLKCEVCGCSRNYSILDEKDKAIKDARSTKPKKASTKASANTWHLLKEQYKGPEAVNYNFRENFKINQSLLHPTFGLGFITKSMPNKIEVVFSEGVKELLHGKT